LVDKTLYEACNGKKPSLVHIIFFCCDAYVYVSKEKMSDLDNKVVKCTLIGYKYEVKGYKIWNLVLGKTIYSCDVTFKEVKSTLEHESEP